MTHAPSQARHLRRLLRTDRGDPGSVLGEARRLDPAHAAPLLALLAGDPRLNAEDRAQCAVDAVDRARAVTRPGQKAEVWSETLKALGTAWALAAADAAVADIAALPDGQWTQDALRAVAAVVGADGRKALLRRALRNPGFEAEGAKAVLAAAVLEREPDLAEMARAIEDPDVRRRVLGSLQHVQEDALGEALAAAWEVREPPARHEALRALAWDCADDELATVAGSAGGRDPESAARLLCACAARADRAGDAERALAWLDDAAGRAAEIGHDKSRNKVERKIAEARQRAGLDPAAAAPAPVVTESKPAVTVPDMAPPTGHAFALVNGYHGGLGTVHLRAVARGASLCAAFGHELWLIDFPADAESLVAAAAAESDIGEDAAVVARLAAEGRLRCLSVEEAVAEGRVLVATTPHPYETKQVEMSSLGGPLGLLVGLGKNGLSRELLGAASHHFELTGRGISLETATAMGILADRLASVGRPGDATKTQSPPVQA